MQIFDHFFAPFLNGLRRRSSVLSETTVKHDNCGAESPVKTIWRSLTGVPLSSTHCLPLTVERCIPTTFFFLSPNFLPILYFLFFSSGFFCMISFFFLLNVKFLQTVLTVYRSASVILADVCSRC